MEVIHKIEAWAEARNLILGSSPAKQILKTFSEVGELAGNLIEGKNVADDIGDIGVTLAILAKQLGYAVPAARAAEYQAEMPETAALALVREIGLLADLIAKQKPADEVFAKVASSWERLQDVCDAADYEFNACLLEAYDSIKDRTGIMRDGVFVKQEDLDKEAAA